ncbi:unnamed protein product [Dovyalis caffra]|uniref:Uncharacterized protein n=1 Tax=Dovyalis caffra TaxID=77055 RepID=A0AAV1R9S5_9ROSI|nr:unnamed protein product [Dovyalis caffra]
MLPGRASWNGLIETQKETHESEVSNSSLVNANDEDRTAKSIFCWFLSSLISCCLVDMENQIRLPGYPNKISKTRRLTGKRLMLNPPIINSIAKKRVLS